MTFFYRTIFETLTILNRFRPRNIHFRLPKITIPDYFFPPYRKMCQNSYFRYKFEKAILSSYGCWRPSEVRVEWLHEDKITYSLAYRRQFFLYDACKSSFSACSFIRGCAKWTLCARSARREMVHYRQEENPFVKILLTQNEYRLESNILLLRQKINFLCEMNNLPAMHFPLGARGNDFDRQIKIIYSWSKRIPFASTGLFCACAKK